MSHHSLIEMTSFPYYAHLQAQVSNSLTSIAWNKVSLIGYIDVLLLAKNQEPPGSFLRKFRAFLEQYPNLERINPLLAALDATLKTLARLDRENQPETIAFALRWNATVTALEKFCLEMVAHRNNLADTSQLIETIQTHVFNLQHESVLPQWVDYIEAQQAELIRYAKLKNIPASTLQKVKLNQQFSATFQTDKPLIQHLITEDPELLDAVSVLNRSFFRLVNLLNQKLPEPDRSLKIKPAQQDLSAPQDFRLTVNYTYDGNDEGEYESNLFAKLRVFLR